MNDFNRPFAHLMSQDGYVSQQQQSGPGTQQQYGYPHQSAGRNPAAHHHQQPYVQGYGYTDSQMISIPRPYQQGQSANQDGFLQTGSQYPGSHDFNRPNEPFSSQGHGNYPLRNGFVDPPPPDKQHLDQSFQEQRPGFFKPGVVFKAYWVERAGKNNNNNSTTSTHVTSSNQFHDEEFYSKIRLFVVIRPKARHAICVPINSYGNRGMDKKHIEVDDHAVVYSNPNRGVYPGEKNLTKAPFRVRLYPEMRDLKQSFINFGKFYSVEYYLRVCPVGKLDKDDLWRSSQYCQEIIGR